jgi:hypothetical protein
MKEKSPRSKTAYYFFLRSTQNLITKNLVFIFFISILSFFACRRESQFIVKEKVPLTNAKTWMEKFITTNQVNPMFDKIIYHWEKASNFRFKNGYNVITIPITYLNQRPEYTGRQVLYLYPWKNGKGFYSTIFEIVPDISHLKNNNGDIDLKTFSGQICAWDLVKGFVRGATYLNGSAQRNIKVKYDKNQTLDISTNKDWGLIANSTTLPSVTVTGFRPAPNWGFFWVTLMNNLGYSTSFLWDGGGSNPCEYTGCGSENPADYFDPNTINNLSQELIDQQWLDEKVKDSTNNPCVSDALSTLSSINEKLPKLIRSFFSSDANFSMTLTMEDLGKKSGGETKPNVSTNDFKVSINKYFNQATDLALATTIIHEAFHCQLMSWFREAVKNNNLALQQELATQYGYLFTSEILSSDSNLSHIVNGMNKTQHQDIVNRYKDMIASALLEFAKARGIENIDIEYCKDLAWSGTMDSKAFEDLKDDDKERIIDRVNAEKDPMRNKGLNDKDKDVDSKGSPCK